MPTSHEKKICIYSWYQDIIYSSPFYRYMIFVIVKRYDMPFALLKIKVSGPMGHYFVNILHGIPTLAALEVFNLSPVYVYLICF